MLTRDSRLHFPVRPCAFLHVQQKNSDFDGNWDPDRNVQRPATLPVVNDLDLAASPTGVDTSPRPFSVDHSSGGGGGIGEPYSPTATTSHYSATHLLAAGPGADGAAAVGMYHDGQYPQQQQMSQYTRSGGAPSILSSASAYPPSSEAYAPSAMRMNKQQEAAQAYTQSHPGYLGGSDTVPVDNVASDDTGLTGLGGPRGLSVINPDEQNDLMSRGSSVVQHRDGGRLRIPENETEIPPSYDSIPPENPHGVPATAATRLQ